MKTTGRYFDSVEDCIAESAAFFRYYTKLTKLKFYQFFVFFIFFQFQEFISIDTVNEYFLNENPE